MLSGPHRLSAGRQFAHAIRRGERAGTRTVVVHLVVLDGDPAPARVGFVVNKAVGNAVARNLVKRRLRHIARAYLLTLPASSLLVVRALPASASARFSELDADVDAALSRVRKRVQLRSVPGPGVIA